MNVIEQFDQQEGAARSDYETALTQLERVVAKAATLDGPERLALLRQSKTLYDRVVAFRAASDGRADTDAVRLVDDKNEVASQKDALKLPLRDDQFPSTQLPNRVASAA